jgi:hypothetical protein
LVVSHFTGDKNSSIYPRWVKEIENNQEIDFLDDFKAKLGPNSDLKLNFGRKLIILPRNFPRFLTSNQSTFANASITTPKNQNYDIEITKPTTITPHQRNFFKIQPFHLKKFYDSRLISMVKYGNSYLNLGGA